MKWSRGGACEEMLTRLGKDTCRPPHIADFGFLFWLENLCLDIRFSRRLEIYIYSVVFFFSPEGLKLILFLILLSLAGS
jgi:hypothetical protein